MDAKTLGEFIESEIARIADGSGRRFAEILDVPPSSVSKFRNHGITDTYSGRPIGDPSLEFLTKLAKATKVDIGSLIALVTPDIGIVDPQAQILADVIRRLPPPERREAEIYVEGLTSKAFNKHK